MLVKTQENTGIQKYRRRGPRLNSSCLVPFSIFAIPSPVEIRSGDAHCFTWPTGKTSGVRQELIQEFVRRSCTVNFAPFVESAAVFTRWPQHSARELKAVNDISPLRDWMGHNTVKGRLASSVG